jgi:rubrerythrin
MISKDDRTMRMCATALEMEERGKVFYQKAERTCQNNPGKETFRMLKEQEIVHISRIKKIYASLEKGLGFPEDWTELKIEHKDLVAFFKDLAKKHNSGMKGEASDLEAVETGIDLEQSAIKFYEDHLKKATDPKERRFIDRMILEEKGHYTTLNDMKFYLTDPAAWFQEKEHGGLDGA